MTRKNGIGRLIVFILLGLVIGGILGECLGLLLGSLGELMNAGGQNNIVRNLFVGHFFEIGSGNPITIDLYMVKFVFGLGIKFNVVSLIGLGISLYIWKWSGDR